MRLIQLIKADRAREMCKNDSLAGWLVICEMPGECLEYGKEVNASNDRAYIALLISYNFWKKMSHLIGILPCFSCLLNVKSSDFKER